MQLDAETLQPILDGFLWRLLPGTVVGIVLLECLVIWERRLYVRTMAVLSPEEQKSVEASRSRRRGMGDRFFKRFPRGMMWSPNLILLYVVFGHSTIAKNFPRIAGLIDGLLGGVILLIVLVFFPWLLLSSVRNDFSLFDLQKVPLGSQADVKTRQTLVSLRGMVIVGMILWLMLGSWLLLPEQARAGLWK